MIVIGKKINFIRLHNFLDRIEVEQVYSALHAFYKSIVTTKNDKGEMKWGNSTFTKQSLEKALTEEESKLIQLTLKEDAEAPEVTLTFLSGNEYVCRLKNQEQFAQIVQFLIDYK